MRKYIVIIKVCAKKSELVVGQADEPFSIVFTAEQGQVIKLGIGFCTIVYT